MPDHLGSPALGGRSAFPRRYVADILPGRRKREIIETHFSLLTFWGQIPLVIQERKTTAKNRRDLPAEPSPTRVSVHLDRRPEIAD